MLFRELIVNSTGNIKASLHVTGMTVSTKRTYSLLKMVQSRELVMAATDMNVKLGMSK